jgi:DegV family protein with EDD domain
LRSQKTKGHLDGRGYYYAFLAGAKRILENQKELNKINVYPVPDADTGSNLASTILTILEKVRPNVSYKVTSAAIATAALEGARGNSGVIFAQFLYGIGAETCDCQEISIKNFTQSLLKAVRYMYEAIANPVEGTMITVIRKWAEYMESQKEKAENFLKLLSNSYAEASQALQETRYKLEAMRKANVVDAGSKGMVLFLEGMIDFLKKPSHKKVLSVRQDVINIEHTDEITSDLVNFRYCTEALIKPLMETSSSAGLDKAALKEAIEWFGDSLVIAGSKETLRVHIHTDSPAELFYKIRNFGKIIYQKVDDMKKQYDTAYHRKWNIALVTDSCCDLPQSVLDHFQVHMVPISLNFGESQYLDKVTVTPDQFYGMLDEQKEFPKSAQPNVKTFENIYSHLASHYDSIIAIHLSGKLSGTYSSSLTAAGNITKESGKKITVIDSKTLSGSLGLLVLKMARDIEEGKSHDETVRGAEKNLPRAKILVGVKTMKYMVRGGRVSPMMGVIANLLNLKPIVSMKEDGEATIFDKAFSHKGSLKNIIKHVKKYTEKNSVREYCILHAHNVDTALEYDREMENLIGKKSAYTMDISPVIGLNAGVGTVAISFLLEGREKDQ